MKGFLAISIFDSTLKSPFWSVALFGALLHSLIVKKGLHPSLWPFRSYGTFKRDFGKSLMGRWDDGTFSPNALYLGEGPFMFSSVAPCLSRRYSPLCFLLVPLGLFKVGHP